MIRLRTAADVDPISSLNYFLTNFTTTILLLIVVFEFSTQILSEYTEIHSSSYPCELDFHEQCLSSERHCFYLQLDTNITANQLLSDEIASRLFAEADSNVSISRLDINFGTVTTPQKEGTHKIYSRLKHSS